MFSNSITPVILCGGSGTRLWPMSRKSFPKQFLKFDFNDNLSLLQKSQERISSLKGIREPILICNEQHRFIVAEQMRAIKVKPRSIILEPIGRNTCPAIATAALNVLEKGEDCHLLILSADHQIENKKNFLKTINKGLDFSLQDKIVTFGILPNSPKTGYGYIKSKECLDNYLLNGSIVETFVEKPNLEKAKEFILDKRFSWNSGMFLFKASVIIQEIEKFQPEVIQFCKESFKKKNYDLDFLRLEEKYFSQCPNISIDVGVMEKTKKAFVVPLDAGWDDIGSWDSVWKISNKNSDGNVVNGNVYIQETKNCYLNSDKRLLAALGLENLIVIDTSDALLIAEKSKAQEVKNIVNELKVKQIPQGIEHQKSYRPWGNYESILKDDRYQVKLIIVKPGERLSLQMHHHRSEHWVVVSGTAKVEVEGKELILSENQSSYIPLGSKHRLSNPGKVDLKIIEIQSGSYLGEDDIERFDDNYGRIGKF